ncbi:hypothetical protein LWP59_05535 [Amycolatopsis acidiphila]|uniref:Uncharacterized protein n=1 Tax=Amycolatopsis acidiphila TaxID=715473 RepID=A0A558AI94_9PSEU|nr:hypothetical protein [Amycolatopsis acidiphila]TVT23911.1 hypothetical protein FNH06_08630 [Amycolatopsis acidiphila]UIJ61112.1 hypothetical protein LWP59_05535 [Amycolatopsis acidiphila]
MDIGEALKRLFEPSLVTIQSSSYLAGKVMKKAAKIDVDRRIKQQWALDRKPRLTPVPKQEHKGGMSITPWELLHTLGRATVLSGQGSSRALAQHWSCLKYISTLQSNYQGRMELSPDGRDPRYHRKSVQAEDLGIAFALAAALRIVQERHLDYRFDVVDADVALEAGWALKGAEVRSRENTLLRPDYFLIGLKEGEPARLVTVECKGSHGKVNAQHTQLAKASAQVHAVMIGDADKEAAPPPSLLMATALAGNGGIEMRILDPEGDGVLAVPGERAPSLNGPVEQFNDLAGIPTKTPEGRDDARPGFYIPPQRSEWFSRVLARTSAASLLTFVGDRTGARELLTRRQQERVGSAYTLPGTDAVFDTGITLGGLSFVGTDHVFRFGSQRMEAFSGVLVGLHRLLAEQDLQGYQQALPQVLSAWSQRRGDAEEDWGGVIAMDNDGAVLGLRPISAGHQDLQYAGPQ